MAERPAPTAMGRRWLGGVALVVAAVLGGLALSDALRPGVGPQSVVDALIALLSAPVGFAAGMYCRRWVGLAGVLWLVICFDIEQGYLNPFIPVLGLGLWYVGILMRDRRQAAQELELLTAELQAGTARLAAESVRLERARIAHELHDIVAHCVSVMVIQAYAGAQLLDVDRAAAGDALDHIAAIAAQARLEIGHLVDLLAVDTPPLAERALSVGLAELTADAAATGIPITLHVKPDLDTLPPAVSSVAYRIVQESITNALKHAPGAALDITVTAAAGTASVEATNGAAPGATVGALGRSGGGHGIDGMRARVQAIGGELCAGPEAGGWRVTARLPLPSVDDDER